MRRSIGNYSLLAGRSRLPETASLHISWGFWKCLRQKYQESSRSVDGWLQKVLLRCCTFSQECPFWRVSLNWYIRRNWFLLHTGSFLTKWQNLNVYYTTFEWALFSRSCRRKAQLPSGKPDFFATKSQLRVDLTGSFSWKNPVYRKLSSWAFLHATRSV